LPDGTDYPPEQMAEGADNPRDTCKRVAPLTNKEARFLKYL
jgi:hypothetical protein